MIAHINRGLHDSSIALCGGDLHRLYEKALSGNFNDELMKFISERLPGVAVLLIAQDSVDHTGNYLQHRGLDIDAIRSFSVDISADSVWFRRQWQQPVGAVFRQDDLIDLEEFKHTKLYRKWLSERGAFEQAVGIVFMREGTRQYALEIRYSEQLEREIARQARKLLQELSPHLQNAAQTAKMKSRLYEAELERDQTLSLIPFPAVIVDEDCRVENMNPLAETMIRAGNTIILGADERLHGIEPENDAELRGAVQEISLGAIYDTKWLRFERTERQRSLLVTLIRMEPLNRMPRNRDTAIRVGTHNRVAVIAQHRDEPSKLSHDMLWQTYGLTSKESELAAALLQGDSIGEIASKKRLSKQTLRNQLGAVMRKTGTRRQVDLVTALLRLSLSSPA